MVNTAAASVNTQDHPAQHRNQQASDTKCFPEVFTSPPPQPKVKKPGQLSKEQVDEYFEKGFLVVKDFFTKDELQRPIQSIHDLVDGLADKLYDAGKIKDKHKDATFFTRLTLLEKEFPGAAILLHKRGQFPKGFQELWANERLLNVMEQLVGPDVAGHPIWNLRTKTPSNESTVVPWHQDNAYLEEGCDKILVATAWIPFLDATVENGCMQVVTGGHRKGKTIAHTCCAGPTWYVQVEEEQIEKGLGVNMEEDTITCEVPFGGMLLINNLIPHRRTYLDPYPVVSSEYFVIICATNDHQLILRARSALHLLKNFSNDIRWSMDLRYHNPKEYNYHYGLKDSILFRSSKDPNYQIDWEKFVGDGDQHIAEEQFLKKRKIDTKSSSSDDTFDTTLIGPWMTRWEIVNHNKHTDAWQESHK